MEAEFNRLADALIAKGHFSEALAVLERALHNMPSGWKPRDEDEESLKIAFWDEEEFRAYITHHAEHLTKPLIWVLDSYSKAWYQLAAVAVEQGRFDNALSCLECGLKLEMDHPELWSEKGYVFARLKRPEEALACYARALSARDWAPVSQNARALRGQGVALIDLRRLDEAEAALKRSLEREPQNLGAQNELQYIDSLRRRI